MLNLVETIKKISPIRWKCCIKFTEKTATTTTTTTTCTVDTHTKARALLESRP